MMWKDLEIGNIRTGVTDYTQSHCTGHWKCDQCLDCAYLPLCFGGCRYLTLLRHGAITGVECKKEFLDATLETCVKQDLAVLSRNASH
jgi:uncharacterized protein